MERVQSLTDLRKGHMSQTVVRNYPQFATIITQLMARHTMNRPDATTLIKMITKDDTESEIVRDLKSQLAAKEEEILKLKELLKSVGYSS